MEYGPRRRNGQPCDLRQAPKFARQGGSSLTYIRPMVRIVIAEDHAMVDEALAALLATERDFRC